VTKKIFPALQAMTRSGHLDGPVVGVARSDWTLEQFRARARESIDPPLRDEAPSAVTSTVVSPRPTPARGRPGHAGDSVHPLVEARRQRGEPTIQETGIAG